MDDPRDKPLTPIERLAMEMEYSGHDDEASALLLLDCVFSRICAADDSELTVSAQELKTHMLEALETWLPADLCIADR